jgi:ADP-ribose pyrophosphatase YjhB (NUDIX family)
METSQQLEAKTWQLMLLEQNLRARTYVGYPELDKRLVRDIRLLGRTALGRLIIPDGTWTIDTHPNRTDSETAPGIEEQQQFLACGLELDERGRPLHPWFHDMIANPTIGVVTGKGFYHNWGPNSTADAIVVQNGAVLLVQREDTGLWALPGGHVDHGEVPVHASRRETLEETGIVLPERITPVVVYNGPVADIRATAHAWPETTAFLYELDEADALPAPHGMSDARAAAWKPLTALSQEGVLFGSHRYLLGQAVARLHQAVPAI